MSIYSFSQDRRIQLYVSESGDTSYIVPVWRIANANRNFLRLEETLAVNRELSNIIRFKQKKIELQNKSLLKYMELDEKQKAQIELWKGKYDTRVEQEGIKDLQIKDLKKQKRILGFVSGGLGVAIIVIVVAALSGG